MPTTTKYLAKQEVGRQESRLADEMSGGRQVRPRVQALGFDEVWGSLRAMTHSRHEDEKKGQQSKPIAKRIGP